MTCRHISLLLFFFTFSQISFAQQSAIEIMMMENKPEGYGEGFVLAQANGTINEVNSTVVLFSYFTGDPRIRGPIQYLAVFGNENGAQLMVNPIAVGSVAEQYFRDIAIEDNSVRLIGTRWEIPFDSSPSNRQNVEQYFIVRGGYLIAQAK